MFMSDKGSTWLKALALSLSLTLLTGCKEVLFSNLEEVEANEMVALLAAAGLDASRETNKDNIYSVLVDEKHIAIATTLLRAEGYPRPKFQSLGDVFSAEGIVGTPFEQHVRYIHAMNEELSRMITSISGVKSARVFVTVPLKERFSRTVPPASASVMINNEPGFDAKSHVSKIKSIVAHSVPNLAYDDVAVAIFETAGPEINFRKNDPMEDQPSLAGVLNFPFIEGGKSNTLFYVLAFFSLCFTALILGWRLFKGSPSHSRFDQLAEHKGGKK